MRSLIVASLVAIVRCLLRKAVRRRILALSTSQGRSDERVRLLGQARVLVLLLLLILRFLPQERLVVLLPVPTVRQSRRRRALLQAVQLSLLLLNRKQPERRFALDLLLYRDLVLDRAVQFGEVDLLRLLEFGERCGRLRVRLEATRLERRVRVLAHVWQRSRVQRLLITIMVLLLILLLRVLLRLDRVGASPECERFRAVPRRTVVA